MPNLTRFAAKKLLDHMLGKAAMTSPSGMWFALFLTDPGPNGSLTGEPTGGSYARVELTSKMSLTDLSTGVSQNTLVAQFPAATAAWGTGALSYFGYMDSATPGSGNMWVYGVLTPPITVGIGDSPPFPEGNIRVSLLT